MDSSEQAACEYLRSRGFDDPVFEPDGKVPPDFLVNGQIAVEVRRLNLIHETASGARGLEEVRIPFLKNVHALLTDIGPTGGSSSWFVRLRFRRPLPPWKRLRGLIRRELLAFHQEANPQESSVQIVENLKLELRPASHPHDQFFVLGGCIDSDTTGFEDSQLESNMRVCIREKSAKVAPFRPKYPLWWLMLIDRIAYANIDRAALTYLRDRLHGELASWDKVFLVNPEHPTRGLQLWPSV